MGYYTEHELTIESVQVEEILGQLDEKEFEVLFESINYDGSFKNRTNWEGMHDEMKKISLKFPELTLSLWGQGDEPDDQWVTYYKAGKMQYVHAEIKFEPFDENLLVEIK